jgi:hypothetical protein
MSYSYANINDLKSTMSLNIEGTVSDTRLRQLVEAVSAEVRNYAKRDFHAVQETRYFDGSGGTSLRVSNLVKIGSGSLTESTSMNGTWDYSWAGQGTSWIGEPYSANPTSLRGMQVGPYRFVTVNDHSNNTAVNSFEKGQRRFKVDGIWGWSFATSQSYLDAVDASTMALDGRSVLQSSTATSTFYAGDMLMIQFDATGGLPEQLYVSARTGTGTLTVERAQNGWAAINWGSPATLYKLHVPAPIREAVIMQAGRLLKRAQGGFVQEAGIPDGGALIPLMPEGLDRDVKQMIGPYRNRGGM